jgi:adenylate kinase family enzyme
MRAAKVYFVLGGPGSGKGTQCSLLEKKKKNIHHISAGIVCLLFCNLKTFTEMLTFMEQEIVYVKKEMIQILNMVN